MPVSPEDRRLYFSDIQKALLSAAPNMKPEDRLIAATVDEARGTELRHARDHSGNDDAARTPLIIYSSTEVGSVDQARLELGPTEFLTKSRGSLQDFTSQVVRMFNTIAAHPEETEHAA
jgi:hypothetical protein